MCSCHYLYYHIFPNFFSGSTFKLAPLTFWHVDITFWSTALLSDKTRCKFILCILCYPSHGVSHFSKKDGFSSWKIIFIAQYLHVTYDNSQALLVDRAREYISVHTLYTVRDTHTHNTSIFIVISVFIN